MQIRPLAVDDTDELRAFYDVTWRAEMDDGRDWNGHWTFDEVASMLRDQTPGNRWFPLATYDGPALVGAGLVRVSELDNLDKAYVFPMVDPSARGRGVGGALLEAMVDRCRELGRTVVTSNAAYAGPEREDAQQVRFARRHGFHVANTEIARHLRLPVDEALLDEVEAEGAHLREGYSVQTFVDELPDDLLPSYAALVNQLQVDAPSGEVDYEEGRLTPEGLHQLMESHRRIGQRVFYSVALREGQVVAQSDLGVQTSGSTAVQWGTFVHREHRGRRLGAAVKVANLRVLRSDRPDVTRIDTSNAETNSYMVSINERLGFQVAAVMPSFVRRLEG